MIKFLTEVQLITSGSAVTPPVGYITLYAKTDGNLYIKNSNGIETQIN
jgi:hypothetical protein